MEGHERKSYVSPPQSGMLNRVVAAFIRHRRLVRSVGRILIVSSIITVALVMATLSVGDDWPVFTAFSITLLAQHLLIYYLMGYWLLPRLLYKRRLGWLLLWIILGIWIAYVINRVMIITVDPTHPQSIRYITQIRALLDSRGWFGPFLSIRVFLWNFIFSIFSPFIFLTLKVIKDTAVLRQQQFRLQRNRLLLDQANAILKQDFLKAQVSPHFLFNTLNSIYSHVVSVDDGAADMVLRLAELMRYNLDMTSATQVLLQEEIDYLQSYIVLEQARHGDRLFVNVNVSGNLIDYMIAPLLLGAYVENAFKHGIRSGAEGSYVFVNVALEADTLLFVVENSISHGPTVTVARKSGGVGLLNVRKRLALLYAERHSVDLDITDEYYRVTLRIDLTRAGETDFLTQPNQQ